MIKRRLKWFSLTDGKFYVRSILYSCDATSDGGRYDTDVWNNGRVRHGIRHNISKEIFSSASKCVNGNKSDEHFITLEENIKEMNGKIDQMDGKMDKQIGIMDGKIGKMDRVMGGMDEKISGMEQKMTVIDIKMNEILLAIREIVPESMKL